MANLWTYEILNEGKLLLIIAVLKQKNIAGESEAEPILQELV